MGNEADKNNQQASTANVDGDNAQEQQTTNEEGQTGVTGQQGNAGEQQVLDSHGQPGINKERHDKEVNALKDTIQKLQGKLDEMAKTEAGREEMGKKIAELEKRLEDEALNHKLEMARCRNTKAAKVLLEDFDGDISKLKEANPWLFEDDKATGSTGFKPTGAAQSEEDEKLDRAFGLKKKG